MFLALTTGEKGTVFGIETGEERNTMLYRSSPRQGHIVTWRDHIGSFLISEDREVRVLNMLKL